MKVDILSDISNQRSGCNKKSVYKFARAMTYGYCWNYKIFTGGSHSLESHHSGYFWLFAKKFWEVAGAYE